jgi:hypothetical protein
LEALPETGLVTTGEKVFEINIIYIPASFMLPGIVNNRFVFYKAHSCLVRFKNTLKTKEIVFCSALRPLIGA